MKYRTLVLACFLLGITLCASGQYTKEFKRIFLDAGYLYQTGFYEEAFSRYKNLLTLDPGNSNILFHCGACCLNIPGNEDQAIGYLKEASSGVSSDYKDNSHKEAGAPVLTWFMLGRAYHLNYQFDEAIESYLTYLQEGVDEESVQLEYARLQKDACERATLQMAEPPSFEFSNVLDQFDDELPSCNNPVISGDGTLLIFLVDYPNDRKIMMTEREGEFWSRPRVISSEIGMVGETYPVSLSYDGKDLYLAHHFYSHSDIFISRRKGGRWSEAEALGNSVNGRTSETHASISKDGKTLYFTSDTRGGLGSFDIYVSRLDNSGDWGAPKNLGPVINTPFEEATPFISANDSILFFSSQGHKTIGGFDVFYSELGPDGQWGPPLSLGYPVNSTADNVFFNPGWDELDGFYAVRRVDDPTSNTINMVIALDPPEEIEEESAAALEAVAEKVAPSPEKSISAVIEPEETDDIHEVLNKAPEEIKDPVPAAAPAGTRRIRTSIPFEHNAFELSMAAMLEAEKVADLMQSNPGTRVLLMGRADETGSPDYNLLLSLQRADRIADYLEMRGIDTSRMTVEGKGESAPVALNRFPDGSDAPLGRYLNRQVTVTIDSPVPIIAPLAGFYVPSSLQAGNNPAEELSTYWFTIQVLASKNPVKDSFFKLEQVKEYFCKDDLYRYTTGSYRSFEEAKSALDRVRKAGYPDAFIQTIDWYKRALR